MESNPRKKQQSTQIGRIAQGSRRKRVGRACDRCHRNACRCSPGVDENVCSKCEEQGQECTFSRPVKRRGPPPCREKQTTSKPAANPRSDHAEDSQTYISPAREDLTPPFVAPSVPMPDTRSNEITSSSPRLTSTDYSSTEQFLNPEMIERLVDIYYHKIYPTRPYFHWPSFTAQIKQQEYRTDWGSYVVTVALCALTAIRVYDGTDVSNDIGLQGSDAFGLSLQCYAAVVNAMPADITMIADYCQAMKANALLASVCLQTGDLAKTVAHMGIYSGLSAIHKFHLEAHWGVLLNEIQREERRRLFWCVYQQSRYLSINFDLPCQQSERKTTVIYPAEVFDDEDITATDVRLRSDQVSFLQGWNFCTDIYRLLENMDLFGRPNKDQTRGQEESPTNNFLSRVGLPKDFIQDSLQFISKIHRDLPHELKAVQSLTGNIKIDRFRLVASNILLTTQNLKMFLVGTESPLMHLRCSIASELLDELSLVPLEFFQCLSTGSLQHLARVGKMLVDTIQPPISAWRYLEIKNIMLILIKFLENIESNRLSQCNLAESLRSQLNDKEQSIQLYAKRTQDPGLLSMGWSLLLGLPERSSDMTADHIAGQNILPPFNNLDGARDTTQMLSPETSQPTHFLDMDYQISNQHGIAQSGCSGLTIGITAAEEQAASRAIGLASQRDVQPPSSDVLFPFSEGASFQTDPFNGWQALFK